MQILIWFNLADLILYEAYLVLNGTLMSNNPAGLKARRPKVEEPTVA